MSNPDAQLQDLLHKSQLSELLLRYFRSIDEQDFSERAVHGIFSRDAQLIRPNGIVARGPEGIQASNRSSFARFRATQHVLTDLLITLGDEAASIRGNLNGMHTWNDNIPNLAGTRFQAGLVLQAEGIRVDGDWRISRLKYAIVWRSGTGLENMARATEA